MATSRSKPNSPLQSTRQMLDELDALMDRMLALPVGDAEDLPPLPRDAAPAPDMSDTLTDEDVRSQESAGRSQESGVRGPGVRRKPGIRNQAPTVETDREDAETPLGAQPLSPRIVRTDLPRVNNGAAQAGPHLPPHKWHEEDIQKAVNQLEEAKKKLVVETAPKEADEGPTSASTTEAPTVDPILQPAAPTATAPAPAASPAAPMLPLLPLIWANNTFDFCSLVLGPLSQGLRGARGRGFLGVVGLLCLVAAGAWFIFDQISGR